jgi:acyl-CoA thioesterase
VPERPVDETPQTRAQQQAERMWSGDRASRGLGIELGSVGPGRASAAMVVRPDMVNGHGICHGGYLFLLADTAFAFACNTRGLPVVAAGADVTFLAPVREGDELVATAVERALAGRSGLYDVTVRRGDDVVLEFRGRSRAVPTRTPTT